MDQAVPVDQRIRIKEHEKRDKDLDRSRELKKKYETWKCGRSNLQRFGKGTGRLRNQRTSEDYADHSIIKIVQNTEKSPGDLRKLAVTQLRWKNIG